MSRSLASQPGIAASRLTRAALVAGLLAICGFTFWVRVAPAWTTVKPDTEDVRLLGADPYFHLRQARFSADHFPHIQRYDPGTFYPQGLKTIHAGLFDLSMAAAAWGVGVGYPDDTTLARVAAWTPPILAVLSTLALFWLTQALLGGWAGLLACAILALYPGAFLDRSVLGFSDHHVAEVFLALLTGLGLFHCVQVGLREAPPSWKRPAL
ncbi:MAG: STT3 domain-containing protein, partial [Planctomycetota bacterium]